MTIIQI